MTQKTCNTCKHAEVDSKDDPCYSCQSIMPHQYARWEAVSVQPIGTLRPERITRHDASFHGERPYQIKVGAGGAGSVGSGGAGVAGSEPVCMSIVWDGPILPKVGTQLAITAINRNFVTVKAIKLATLAEWQKKQLIEDVLKEWCGGTTKDNMLVLVDKVLEAIGRRDVANI